MIHSVTRRPGWMIITTTIVVKKTELSLESNSIRLIYAPFDIKTELDMYLDVVFCELFLNFIIFSYY